MSVVTRSQSDREFVPVSAGTHLAVCVDCVDLGLETVEYNGETKLQPKHRLVFEVGGEFTEDGRPMTIGRKVTSSLHEMASLTTILTTWQAPGFTSTTTEYELDDLIGISARLEVVHKKSEDKKRTYAVIDRVYPTDEVLKASTKNDPETGEPLLDEAGDPVKTYKRVKDRTD